MHRRTSRAALALALAVVAIAAGCAGVERGMTVRVTGTEGVRFEGECVLQVAGARSIQRLEEQVPFELELTGHDLSCMLQNLSERGTLNGEILVNGNSMAFNSTRQQFGHISVATP